MGGVMLSSGDTRLYYYDTNNGSIIELVVNNAFTVGRFITSGQPVPSAEVRHNSPVAVTLVTNRAVYIQVHTFFFSPDNVLSQYYYDDELGIQGGPDRTTCVTSKGFVGEPGNQMLYALADSTAIRVGFVSAGPPNTISEAVYTGSGWSLASLSN
ncbi:hypothetical protein GYMLUDRAFT_77357 [Collybiopsis luxurians FD-317 M1]|uniref:Unplaced genomic scaffold GYMLUscaffold_75, whole genome shotgun sequence n=1 Tax=Collybiopsis luxurians FD-317 M1 TaxID=944289 RepID=A0A0D0BW25_9AGAR|nr:hypothetical protein GYMLUDRAFT_77357 [Collybiopsis luxurians FD-317 M1]